MTAPSSGPPLLLAYRFTKSLPTLFDPRTSCVVVEDWAFSVSTPIRTLQHHGTFLFRFCHRCVSPRHYHRCEDVYSVLKGSDAVLVSVARSLGLEVKLHPIFDEKLATESHAYYERDELIYDEDLEVYDTPWELYASRLEREVQNKYLVAGRFSARKRHDLDYDDEDVLINHGSYCEGRNLIRMWNDIIDGEDIVWCFEKAANWKQPQDTGIVFGNTVELEAFYTSAAIIVKIPMSFDRQHLGCILRGTENNWKESSPFF
jgi:hypothetical protein